MWGSLAVCALTVATVAGGTNDTPAGARVLDARAVRTIHLDLLGRPPLPAESAKLVGHPLAEVAALLVASPEFYPRWFEEQLYYFLLVNNFRPQSERIVAIPRDLAEHKLDVREAIHLIALSANFDQRNPGADTFVTVVMEQLTGMEVQKNTRELDIGKRIYDGGEGTFLGSKGKCQADIVRIAVESRAFAKHFVGREYERIVHAKPDAKEWGSATGEFAKDPSTYAALVSRWLVSDAYAARLDTPIPLGNRLFVRSLFVDLLGRVPTEEESEPMRQALDGLSDPVPLRSVLVRMMLDSNRVPVEARDRVGDPAAWIRERFLRFYGRNPSDSELATFVAAWNEPECRPQTILCALLASPEYQRY
jgi:hypothetical protein